MKPMAKACQWDYLKESISINVCNKRDFKKRFIRTPLHILKVIVNTSIWI